jgi:superfamily II RNA helicase
MDMCCFLLQDAARGIAALSKEAGLEVDEEEYLGSFRPSLMDVFYSWSKGKSFAEVISRKTGEPFAWSRFGVFAV